MRYLVILGNQGGVPCRSEAVIDSFQRHGVGANGTDIALGHNVGVYDKRVLGGVDPARCPLVGIGDAPNLGRGEFKPSELG